MKRLFPRILFLLIAGVLFATFALHAIPSGEYAMKESKHKPLLALARSISANHQNSTNFELNAVFKPALSFSLPDLTGKTRTLEEFRGKVVFLNFWATWCPPCRDEWPAMQYLAQEMAGKDFVMIAASIDEDEKELKDFLREFGIFPEVVILRDLGEKVARSYGTTGWPETYIISPEGELLHHFVGPRDWNTSAALSYIQKLIDGET